MLKYVREGMLGTRENASGVVNGVGVRGCEGEVKQAEEEEQVTAHTSTADRKPCGAKKSWPSKSDVFEISTAALHWRSSPIG